MFELMKGKGFAVTLGNGCRVEVDFGPMSESEFKNVSRQQFEATPKSNNAEVRIYNKNARRIDIEGNEAPTAHAPDWCYPFKTADQFVDILNAVAELS